MRLHSDPLGEWLKWKQEYQRRFEAEHGGGSFIEEFGRNYL